MSWISIDVDLDDVYDNMGDYDRKKMVNWLEDDGYTTIITKSEGHDIPPTTSLLESQFHDKLIGLSSKFYSMNNEEIEIIENLHKKYC
jgi:hypothetical protein